MTKPNKRKRDTRHPKLTEQVIDDRVWYVLRVESQKEFVTQNILQSRGLLTYVPVRKEWRYKNRYDRALKRPKTLVSYPETVGYVFAGFTVGQLVWENVPHWLKIFAIPTIKSVLGVQGCPEPVDKAALKRLASQFPNGMQKPSREQYMRTHKEFSVGDEVMICKGPFEGQVVPVQDIADGKAKLPIQFLGEIHAVTVDCFDLEKYVA